MSGNPVIGLVMATLLEAVPFIRDLSLREWGAEPFSLYGDDRIALIISGIGKANAAMACAYLIQTRRPALVCNLGAAGAADRRCALGECYHISKVIEPDRPGLKSGLPHEQLPDMEGAAVVQTCRRFHVKCFLFKFVSDTPDHRQSDEIVKNIELYRDAHSRFFKDSVLPRLLSLAG